MTEIEAFIRQTAAELGVDPDIAVRVAMSEGGLNDPVRRAGYEKGGFREPSFGPYQLLIGGPGTGFPEGMGNDALAAGIDPRDPNQWRQGVRFALSRAKESGWSPWYGAAKAGISRWEGLGGKPSKQFNLPPLDPLDTYGDYAETMEARRNAPAGPVEAAGGGEGNEAGRAVEPLPPLTMGGEKAKKKNWWEIAGDALTAAGSSGGGQGFGYQVPAQPGPARVDVGAAPIIDPNAAEQRRMALAAAMARLNSGSLWG